MKSVAITYVEAITALGNLDETWTALLNNQSALAPAAFGAGLDKFPVGSVPGLGGGFGSSARFENLLRMLFKNKALIPDSSEVIISTTKGAVDELLDKTHRFWELQPWDVEDHLKSLLGQKNRGSTVSAACASGTLGLIEGALRLVSGEAEFVTVVGIDVLSRFVMSGFARLQALSQQRCRPFDKERDGLSLGEGAALVVMTTTETAHRNGLPVLAELRSWGSACDASHITAPDREAAGLKKALGMIFNGTKTVGAINAHGTGTRFNDAMEMHAFSTFWEAPPPFHSVKGAIGHCLGAAGVIEAAIAVRSLLAGVIPPSVGMEKPESRDFIISGQKAIPLEHLSVLSCNSGFGGINAGVLLTA